MALYPQAAGGGNETRHPDARLTLREAFEKHYDKSELAKMTLGTMRNSLDWWERLTGNPPIGEITNETIATFRAKSIEAGHAPHTIKGRWTNLRSILRLLAPPIHGNPMGLGIIAAVPYMKPVKIVHSHPRRIDLEDLTRAYIACKHAQFPRRGGVNPAAWWRALLTTGYFTALRRGDLFRLTWADVDLDRGELTFTAQKTGKGDAFVLHPVAIDHLRMIHRPSPQVFAGLSGRRFTKEWRTIMERSKIAERFTLHDLRRTCASECERVRPGMGRQVLQHAPRSHTEASYVWMGPELAEAMLAMRVPPGWRPGVKMALRDEEKRRQETLMLRPPDFAMPRTPRPDEWRFSVGAFWFSHQWFSIPQRLNRVLSALAAATRPVGMREMASVAMGAHSDIRNPLVQGRVHALISDLRKHLRKCFGLSEHWDPVPCVERGRGGAWTIVLPPGVGAEGGAA